MITHETSGNEGEGRTDKLLASEVGGTRTKEQSNWGGEKGSKALEPLYATRKRVFFFRMMKPSNGRIFGGKSLKN
jgi:hypothetical protein